MTDNPQIDRTVRQYLRKQDYQGPVNFPVYDDMANADPELSSVAISNGQHPHGLWWHDGTQWFAGDRSKFSVDQHDVGSQTTEIVNSFAMPINIEIDVWQSQIDVVSGSNEDVQLDIRDATAGEVLYSHNYGDHGNEVDFGDPITVEEVPDGNTVELRIDNAESSTISVSGWILWSFQEVI